MATTPWHIGEHLRVRGQRWTLRELTAWPACTELRLSSPRRPSLVVFEPFDRPLPSRRTRGLHLVRLRRWLHVVRRTIAETTTFGGGIAAAGARVEVLPHQLEPLLAVVRHGVTRLLLADGVGLGKTIQAGLLLIELAAREPGFRAAILVPAGLRSQWAQELRDKFALEVHDADAGWLRRATAERPPDVNPWSLPGVYLTSFDFAKRTEVLRAVEGLSWDLTIVDEAHLASGTSDRRRAAHAISCRSRRVMLLSATPDTGDARAFGNLCGIGSLDTRAPPVVVFRRTRQDLVLGRARRSVLLRVRPTLAEQRMHALLERYTRLIWTEASRRHDAAAKLAATVLRKRALSSASSLAVSAARRLLLLGRADAIERQLTLFPEDDEDPHEDAIDDGALAAVGLGDVRLEKRLLAVLVEAARVAGRAESKAARLLRLLARVPEPVLVFTEYRDTLDRLDRLLRSAGRRTETIHGGMERRERERVQAVFNRGGVTLLATDAASEGLNLHHHCRVVVHYELPWRPARIEQRAGRVDRLGQARRVHEIALVATGTAERLVLEPLLARAARARASGGAGAWLLDALSESAVSELVMGGALPELSSQAPPPVRTLDLRSEAVVEADRLRQARSFLARSPPRESGVPDPLALCRRPTRWTTGGALVAVVVISLLDVDGRAMHAEIHAMQCESRVERSARSTTESRDLVDGIRRSIGDRESEMGRQVSLMATEARARIAAMVEAGAAEMVEREEALRHAQPSAAMQMVQAGLFDRRALAARARASAVRGALLEAVDVRRDARERHAIVRVEIELVAVLAGTRR